MKDDPTSSPGRSRTGAGVNPVRDARRAGRDQTARDTAVLREVGANLARIAVDAYPTASQTVQTHRVRRMGHQIAKHAKFAREAGDRKLPDLRVPSPERRGPVSRSGKC